MTDLKIKPWEELTLADDFMFCKIMSYENICKQLLEYMMNIHIEKLVYHETQKSVDMAYDAKGIRMDVYVADSNRVFDIEMQTTKKIDLPKRSRYYQSLIDIDMLKKGELYTSLKESYIIFICTKDPFNENLSRYTFINRCNEKPNLILNDKITKLFYNVEAYEKEANKEVRAVLELIKKNKPSSRFTEQIQQLVNETKSKNEKWRNEYMTLEMIKIEEREIGKEAGLAIGSHEKAVETAKIMKKDGLPDEKIVQYTGLTIEEIQTLN